MNSFANTGKLARFMLRRERIIASVWIIVLLLVVVGLVPAMIEIVGDDNELASMLENPAMIAMIGPAFAVTHDGFGALYTTMMLLFTAFTVGIMNIFLIVRHTRADEEQGRYEVIRSLPVGRLSNLSAAYITALVVNLILSVLTGAGMYLLGDESMSFSGSMLWGVGLGSFGLVMAAVTALFCQLTSNARSATSNAFIFLIVCYFLRAVGDMNADMAALSYINPLGLANRTAPYAGDCWHLVPFMLLIALICGGIAYKLNAIRDIDQGIIPARPGRAEASRFLRTPTGLTLRMLRTALIWSLVGMFALGASYATILGDMNDFVAKNEFYQSIILLPAGISFEVLESMSTDEIVGIMNAIVEAAGFTLAELFASMVNNMMALVTLVAPILFIMRVKSEEKAARSELIMATPTSRLKYFAGFTGIAFVSVVLLQFVLALGLYSMAQSTIPDVLSFGFLFEAAMVYIPALWAITAITVFLVGAMPKLTGIVWGYYGYSFLVVFIGRMEIFPSWLAYTTPLGFVPQLPMDETNYLTLTLLTVFALVVTAVGFFFYRQRDLNTVTH